MTISSSISLRKNYRSYLLLTLFFVLPFFHKYSTIALVTLLVVSLYEIIRKREFPKFYLFWFLPILFLYYLISEGVSGGTLSQIEKRLLLLFIPLAFALNPDFYRDESKRNIYASYIAGNLVAVLVCLVRAVVRSVIVQDGQWTFNPKVIQNTEHDFLTSSVMGGNYFFGDEFSLFMHPTYAGILIVFAQYLVFEVFKTTSGRRNKQMLIGAFVFFVFALFLLSSKAAIVSSLLILFWTLLRVSLPAFVKISAIAAVILVSVLFLFFNPRLKVFKDTLKTTQLIDPNARYGYDLRILSWDASLDLIRENWLLGVGEGKKRSALVEVYKSKGYIVPAEKEHNSHNQYFDFMIGGGIIGLGLFITGIAQLFIRSVRETNLPLMAFLLIFSFNALFENLLSRHAGILFFSIFITLFASRRQRLSAAQE